LIGDLIVPDLPPDRLEADLDLTGHSVGTAIALSQAISLKRIADVLVSLNKKLEEDEKPSRELPDRDPERFPRG
jgi:hypothetical protein